MPLFRRGDLPHIVDDSVISRFVEFVHQQHQHQHVDSYWKRRHYLPTSAVSKDNSYGPDTVLQTRKHCCLASTERNKR